MLKRTLAVVIATLALLAGRALAADAPHAPAHGTSTVVESHEAGHAAHIDGDERLVPIPPSKDTIVSAVWVLIIFLVMMAILYNTAWKQILLGLKKREDRIRQDIAEAEASRKRSEATLAEYQKQLAAAESQVRDILSKAATDAERIATSMKMQAQQEAEEAKERATRDIEAARKAAVTDIYAQAADLSTAIAEKILRRSLNAKDQSDLVAQSLEQLQTAGKV